MTVFLSSCALGNAGLPSNLQAAGTSGASFQIVSKEVVDGIVNRTYKKRVLTSLSSGFVGAPSATGGTNPITCTLIAGALPSGLTLAADTGTPTAGTDCFIQGTPTQTGAFSFTIQAIDGDFPPRTAVAILSMTVRPDFSITASPSSLPTAVQGRSYGIAPLVAPALTTNLSSTAPLPVTSGGTAPFGNGPIASGGCAVTASTNPGMAGAPDTTNTECLLESTSVSASGSFSVALSATDNPILDPETCEIAAPSVCDVSVPARTVTAAAVSLTVNPAMVLAETSGAPVPAVSGRSYGVGSSCSGGSCKPVTYAISGGLGAYTTAPSAGPLTCGFSGGGLAGTYTCSSGSVSGSSGILSLAVADTGNAATPSQALTDTTQTLTVNPILSLSGNGTPQAAVNGRTYGFGPGCSGAGGTCQPYTYSISGGLGGYSSSGTAGPLACSLSGTTYNCNSSTAISCGCGPSAQLSLTVSDTANASTPGTSVTNSSEALAIANAVSVTPPTGLAAAVIGRTYGENSDCGLSGNAACTPANFTATGGLGNYQTVSASSTSGQTAFTCTASGTTYACATGAIGASETNPLTLSITAHDTANASTPSGSSPASSPASIAVNREITFASQPSAPVASVNGRAYGTGLTCSGGACVPLQYTITGGLGLYTSPLAEKSVSQATSFTCTVSASTYSCSTGGVGDTGTTMGFTFIASEGGNASTPGNPGVSASTITIPVALAMILTGPGSGSLAAAVTGRSYGQANKCGPSGTSTCEPIDFTVAGGLGNYQAIPNTTTTGGSMFSCSLTFPRYSCSSLTVNDTNSMTLNVTATETGNVSTPAGSASASATTTVDQPLSLLSSFGSTWPNAVVNRSYGSGNNATFSASNGLGTYTFPVSTPSSFPSGLSCSAASNIYTCSASSGAITSAGSYSPSVTVTDTANASTPAATVASDPSSQLTVSLTVNSALTVTTTRLPNVLVQYPYQQTLSATGGLGGPYSWVAGGNPDSLCPTTGTLPSGLSVASNGRVSGTLPSTSASTADADYSFAVCAEDAANATTPAGGASPVTFSLSVLNPLAYVAEETGSQVEIVNTNTNMIGASPIGTGGTSVPYDVAVSPDGTRAYVTLARTDQFVVIDTITNAPITGSPFSVTSGCTPHGIAITPDGKRAYIACSGSDEVVAIETADNTTVDATIATGTGSAPEGVAIKPDGTRVCVTLNGTNKLAVIDNTVTTPKQISGSPFDLSGSNASGPYGIALTPVSGGSTIYAYIAQGTATSPNTPAVTVYNVTSDPPTAVNNGVLAMPSGSLPQDVAVTPDGSLVYVSLTEDNSFAVLNNTTEPSVNSTVSLGSSTVPAGVAIPPLSPVPGTGFRVYIIVNATSENLDIIDSASQSLDSASPIGLATGSGATGIANIPVPQ